ncbi:MAG: hypothetical protein ACRD1E_00105, partial [Terriglobales bacterium]
MRTRIRFRFALAAALLAAVAAQTPATTNADVVKMVKGGLEESVVVAAIRSRPASFDLSPDALLALHQAGVTKAELDAMLAAAAPATAAAAPAAPQPRLPTATLVSAGATQELPLERTELAQTKTKPTSMASLAADSTLSQAIQAGASDATAAAANHISSSVGNTAVQQAGSVFTGMLSRRKPGVTYVWGVPGPTSANVLPSPTPQFTVDFAGTPGVNADDFEPAIVKLTPAQNTC